MPPGIYKRKSPSEYFWAKVDKKDSNECWLWLGSIKENGYGQFRCPALNTRYAHRASYQLKNGPITSSDCVCHKCDNPACVNPNHLFVGTQQDNLRDMTSKGRRATGEKTKTNKLTQEQVLEIREKYKSGIKNSDLKKEYGVSHSTIHRVVYNKLWTKIL